MQLMIDTPRCIQRDYEVYLLFEDRCQTIVRRRDSDRKRNLNLNQGVPYAVGAELDILHYPKDRGSLLGKSYMYKHTGTKFGN